MLHQFSGFYVQKYSIIQHSDSIFWTFEEINLRFYVTRKEGNQIKRGVVFINETIPYQIVAWVANKLYNEHYTVVPTKNDQTSTSNFQKIRFEWELDSKWNSIDVRYSLASKAMQKYSLELFIYEHYFGYTKVNENKTEEYHLRHPSWETYPVFDYAIDCDFEAMYGKEFSILNTTKPAAVFIAKGSRVGIEWKRNKLKI